MSSGIYKLTFSSGRYYIGKSINIDKRWDQHFKNMLKGKHAKAIQEEYNRCGYPEAEVLAYVHEDHIDLAEAMFIHANWNPSLILNTTKEAIPNDNDWEILRRNLVAPDDENLLRVGTACHLAIIEELEGKIIVMESELESQERDHEKEMRKIKSGTKVKELEDSIDILLQDCTRKSQEIHRLKNRGFWDRLFNV